MAEKKAPFISENITLSNVIAIYPTVLEAKLNEKSGKKEFNITILISKDDKDNLEILKDARLKIEKKVFAPDGVVPEHLATKWSKPLKKGDEYIKTQSTKFDFELKTGVIDKEVYDRKVKDLAVYEGRFFIRFKQREDRKPFVVDGAVADIMDKNLVKSGIIVNIPATLYAFEVNGNCGVTASFHGIQLTGKTEKIELSAGGGGRPDKKSLFKKLGNSERQEAYTADAKFDEDTDY